MQRPELYRKTVDILYQAYFNDTLEHGHPCGCAVGNIVAANSKTSIDRSHYLMGDTRDGSQWFWKIKPENVSRFDRVNKTIGENQIISTGYEELDIKRIEYAFENCDAGKSKEDYMFNGLVAVLEVLKEIHQVEDNEPEIARFKQHYASLT